MLFHKPVSLAAGSTTGRVRFPFVQNRWNACWYIFSYIKLNTTINVRCQHVPENAKSLIRDNRQCLNGKYFLII